MTHIKLHNTATRQKEVFKPLDEKNVRMYVCGPTVYDRAHLGNARPVVVFDVLFRLLRHTYGAEHVTYVCNYTDIDDKIIARAREEGRDIAQITAETIKWYEDDMITGLGTLAPTHQPRATDYVPQMIAMIDGLIAKDHAYEAQGHILFKVRSYTEYGAFSGRSVEDMIAGARVEVAPYKADPLDFVLWKPSTGDEPAWDSPWGRGRPGWHIECSAMARDLLGESFDIHGGGLDLQFPHHENEIAQSKCACEGDFAQVWMHNEMLQVEGKKMSKSLGNFFTVRDLLDQGIPGEVIRFVLLSTHYSKPMDWTAEKAVNAHVTLANWSKLTAGVTPSQEPSQKVLDALSDDVNTPAAIAALHDLIGDPAALKASASLVGLPLKEDHDQKFLATLEKILTELVQKRTDAKLVGDYATADQIRDGITAVGIKLNDQPGNVTSWEVSLSAIGSAYLKRHGSFEGFQGININEARNWAQETLRVLK